MSCIDNVRIFCHSKANALNNSHKIFSRFPDFYRSIFKQVVYPLPMFGFFVPNLNFLIFPTFEGSFSFLKKIRQALRLWTNAEMINPVIESVEEQVDGSTGHTI